MKVDMIDEKEMVIYVDLEMLEEPFLKLGTVGKAEEEIDYYTFQKGDSQWMVIKVKDIIFRKSYAVGFIGGAALTTIAFLVGILIWG